MTRRTWRSLAAAVGLGALGAALFAAAGTAAPEGFGSGPNLTNVPTANAKTTGFAAPNVLSAELTESIVAQGSMALDGGTQTVPYFGYDGDGSMLPPLGSNVEATKTEPDKNTYLVLGRQHGADGSYDYGSHFLFQGHEVGSPGYITRVNLDADGAHRVTLLASSDVDGQDLPDFDGSTWDPWAQRLLFTSEEGADGGVWQATPDYPSQVKDISGILGRAGYEGIQNDSAGNLWIIEDSGGATGTGPNVKAKQPNSFVYRFVPTNPRDLTQGGKLQVLQVTNPKTNLPITFHAGQVDQDITSPDTALLHSYGTQFPTKWITIHDTATDGTSPFDANALAKSKLGTPFKRPENGQFRPGSRVREFYFDETGDTNATSSANAGLGGWGDIQKLTQANPSADAGTLTLFYAGDQTHTAFDNVGWMSADQVVFVEDAGDTLHSQRNALDSAWLFDANTNYSNVSNQPIRILAQGRDASATVDSGLSGSAGFQNEGDNEITGWHVSDGDPSADGILGARIPRPFQRISRWRVFYTQQHGDNATWEITANAPR